MFDFKEKFKDRPTNELLQMLQQPDQYQVAAIEAAKEIIEYRKATHPEMFEGEANKLKSETIVQAEKPTLKAGYIWEEDEMTKSIKVKTRNHILSILFVYLVINSYFVFKLFSMGSDNNLGTSSLPAILPTLAELTLALIGSFFFFKREKAGWFILVFDFTFRLIVNLKFLSLYFTNSSNPYGHFSILNDLLPPTLFGLVLYRLGSERLMEEYKVNKQTLMYTMVASIVFAAILTFIRRFS